MYWYTRQSSHRVRARITSHFKNSDIEICSVQPATQSEHKLIGRGRTTKKHV